MNLKKMLTHQNILKSYSNNSPDVFKYSSYKIVQKNSSSEYK